MSSPEHIILCVEETNNWHLAPARRLVMEADPALERTVLVSTKLDTKFAQFGRADELDQFLRAAPLRRAHLTLTLPLTLTLTLTLILGWHVGCQPQP